MNDIKRSVVLIMVFLSVLDLPAQETSDGPFMQAYVVVSDTSLSYSLLRNKLFELSEQMGIEIDTMDRGFDTRKNLICLPEDFPDDIYAGEYYPRRYPSETLSLEYLAYYDKRSAEKKIALVTVITGDKEKAEENLEKIREYSPGAFMLQTKIYLGCMH
ncbi:MAG: hypothetical protein PVF73_07880 [Bacteroidales bacterium]